MPVKYVDLSMKTTLQIGEKDFAIHFLEFISKFEDGLFCPSKYNHFEPIKHLFDKGDVRKPAQLWVEERAFMFKTDKPYKCNGDISILDDSPVLKVPNELYFYVDQRFFEDPNNIDKFKNFSKKLYDLFKPTYGFIAHEDDYNAKNRYYEETPHGSREKWVGRKLEECLPGIYWANFFGPIYVDWFGRENFLSLPCRYKEQLPDGGFLVLTAESPLDYKGSAVKDLEREVIEFLGKEAFFDINEMNRKCSTPFP